MKYKHVLFLLNHKIWNIKKPIINIIGNTDKEMILLFDLSNYIERQYSLMFIYSVRGSSIHDEKSLKNYFISVLTHNIFKKFFLRFWKKFSTPKKIKTQNLSKITI